LPIIDGAGAVTAPGLNYWSETRGVIKIGGANTPPDLMPRYIVIENLEVLGANQANSFSDDGGASQTYDKNASAIYLEKGENITIRNSIFHDSGNGLFVASSDATVSRDILIQGNYIYGNGNSGSIFEHNSYTAAIGAVHRDTDQHGRSRCIPFEFEEDALCVIDLVHRSPSASR
jgi:hypothetical protein